MNGKYVFRTSAGTFKITADSNGWKAMFEDECLGHYASAKRAAKELAGGHCASPSCGAPSEFGVSGDLFDWEFVRAQC